MSQIAICLLRRTLTENLGPIISFSCVGIWSQSMSSVKPRFHLILPNLYFGPYLYFGMSKHGMYLWRPLWCSRPAGAKLLPPLMWVPATTGELLNFRLMVSPCPSRGDLCWKGYSSFLRRLVGGIWNFLLVSLGHLLPFEQLRTDFERLVILDQNDFALALVATQTTKTYVHHRISPVEANSRLVIKTQNLVNFWIYNTWESPAATPCLAACAKVCSMSSKINYLK